MKYANLRGQQGAALAVHVLYTVCFELILYIMLYSVCWFWYQYVKNALWVFLLPALHITAQKKETKSSFL